MNEKETTSFILSLKMNECNGEIGIYMYCSEKEDTMFKLAIKDYKCPIVYKVLNAVLNA
jgi:hypothetical protein